MPSSLPLVGRAAEVDALVAAYTAAAGGRSQVMLLTGNAGIGKTRLVAGLGPRPAGPALAPRAAKSWLA
jgi:AAA ATPase domain